MNKKLLASLLACSLLVGGLSSCQQTAASSTTDNSYGADTQDESDSEASSQSNAITKNTSYEATAIDLSQAVQINMRSSGIDISGSGATLSGTDIVITEGGSYVLSGLLTEGRVVVDAADQEVVLIFNDAEITCSYSSPLFIYDASLARVHLLEGTNNVLSDAASYVYSDKYSSSVDEEPNACLYSKSDLMLEGSGSLSVNGLQNNGITSKDTLSIFSASLVVDALNHGINGKDNLSISQASLTVSCGGDALRSTNDSDENLGWISIADSNLVLEAGEDGIQAETKLDLGEGSYVINSGDDAVHSNGDLSISAGSFTLTAVDDAVHADGNLEVSGGTFDILSSYEGLEAANITLNGGEFSIKSNDDALNAAGGQDASGLAGPGERNPFGGGFGVAGDYSITLSGLVLNAVSGGDGIDSNGALDIQSGLISIVSTGQQDGALDFDGTGSLGSATLFAASFGRMVQVPSSDEQPVLSIGFDSTLSAGTYVSISNETQSYVYLLEGAAGSFVFTSPDLQVGDVYSISYGGSYEGGQYSGGTLLAEIELNEGVNSYGSATANEGFGGFGDSAGKQPGATGDFFEKQSGARKPEEVDGSSSATP